MYRASKSDKGDKENQTLLRSVTSHFNESQK